MKVVIEVKEDNFSKNYYKFQQILIPKKDCEVIPENKQEQISERIFKNIYNISTDHPHKYQEALDIAKKSNWIVKDEIEEAIEEADRHYKDEVLDATYSNYDYECVLRSHALYKKVIELLQKRIKELEGTNND